MSLAAWPKGTDDAFSETSFSRDAGRAPLKREINHQPCHPFCAVAHLRAVLNEGEKDCEAATAHIKAKTGMTLVVEKK
jgi:hypothetical protein